MNSVAKLQNFTIMDPPYLLAMGKVDCWLVLQKVVFDSSNNSRLQWLHSPEAPSLVMKFLQSQLLQC